MTEDNRAANVAAELERAAKALAAASALVAAGLAEDAISRAYYSVHHHLRALLYTEALEPRSHSGAVHLFAKEFVRPGRFPTSDNRLVSGMQRARELADYDAAVTFSVEDAEAEVAAATDFGARARAWLLVEGWAQDG